MSVLRLGKHRGRSFDEITRLDRPYCAWVLRAKPESFQRFHKYLRKTHGGVLGVGRHKGMFFSEVLELESDYCFWVVPYTHCNSLQVTSVDVSADPSRTQTFRRTVVGVRSQVSQTRAKDCVNSLNGYNDVLLHPQRRTNLQARNSEPTKSARFVSIRALILCSLLAVMYWHAFHARVA